MQANDQNSPADENSTSSTAETDSKPTGLVKGILDAVVSGKESAVIVQKADTTTKNPNKNINEQNEDPASGN